MKQVEFGIDATQTRTQTFEGQSGEKFSLRLYVSRASDNVSPGDSIPVRIAVNVSDVSGKSLVYDENVGRSYSIQPIELENEGKVTVAVENFEDEPIQITMNVGKAGVARPFDNGIEIFSNWLMIISAPIFGLGIWLLIPKRNGNTIASSDGSIK